MQYESDTRMPSFEQLRRITDNMLDIVMLTDINGNLEYVSPAYHNTLKYQKSVIGQSIFSFIHKDDLSAAQTAFNKLIHTGMIKNVEVRLLQADGHSFWIEAVGKTLLDDTGLITGTVVAARDITERKATEQSLQRSEAKNRALLNALPDVMLTLNRDGIIVDSKNNQFNDLITQSDNFLGKNIFAILPAKIACLVISAIKQVFQTGELQTFEFQLPETGAAHEWEARIVISGLDEVLVLIRDITERKQMEQQLRYLSLHDSLTGLYNRHYFEDATRRFSHIRYAPLGIIFCDVDGLKLANDMMGHTTGDELLLAAARILKTFLRGNDVVARIGGDEFAAILPNCPQPVVENACQRIKNAVEEYNQKNPGLRLSISLGFAVSQDAVKIPDLLKEADNKMYREKLFHSQSTRSAIVQTVFSLLESRDFIKEGHVDRLQDLLFRLAQAIGLPPQKLPDLHLLAQFHDIGKVGIPDHILFKPGRLTDDEITEIRRHSEIGHRIAQSAPDLAHISDWILKHHEWWNGQGYPLGLKDLAIPLECRIFTIIDAYDSMTSDRPYRKALSPDKAIAEIKRYAGIQFDPMLADMFIKLLI